MAWIKEALRLLYPLLYPLDIRSCGRVVIDGGLIDSPKYGSDGLPVFAMCGVRLDTVLH